MAFHIQKFVLVSKRDVVNILPTSFSLSAMIVTEPCFSLGFKARMLSTWAMNLSTKNLVHDLKYLVSKRCTDRRVRFFWLNFICLFFYVCLFLFCFPLCFVFFFKIDYGSNNMNVMMTINCGDLSRFSHGKHVVCILTQYSWKNTPKGRSG